MLELIKKKKINWLVHWVRRNCLLEGMVNVKKVRSRRRYQMIDNFMINGLYEDNEKEGREEGRVENAEFAVKHLPLGRTL